MKSLCIKQLKKHHHWVIPNAAWLHTNTKPFTPSHNQELFISVRYCQYRNKTY